MGAGCGLPGASRLAQSSAAPIGAVDLPMPRKLRRRQAAVLAASNVSSNSVGGTYPSAECSRFRL